jgi:hypothetical protein
MGYPIGGYPMNRQPYAQVQIYALECPKCKAYNLVQSEDPAIYYTCPNPECNYVIEARPLATLNHSQNTK